MGSVLRLGEVLWDSTGECFEASLKRLSVLNLASKDSVLRLASKHSRVFS